MRKFFLLLFVSLFLPAEVHADPIQKESGYTYILRNYFSKRRPNYYSHKGSPRSITLYSGASVYRETGEEVLFPISSFILGFNQRIKEIPTVGDINLQIGVQSIKLDTRRGTAIEIIPKVTLPDIRSGFPFYVGVGLGVGIFPRHLIKDLPAFALNGQIFTGTRILDLYYNAGLIGELKLKMQVPVDDLKMYLEVFISLGLTFSF